jgi:hypothetical protein
MAEYVLQMALCKLVAFQAYMRNRENHYFERRRASSSEFCSHNGSATRHPLYSALS